MKIGNVWFNLAFFAGWTLDQFKSFAKSANYERDTGLTVDKLAKKLGIVKEIPNSTTKGEGN